MLRGSDFTVVGKLTFRFDDLQSAEVETVRVNARTIENHILYTDDYEFVTFAPTTLTSQTDAAGTLNGSASTTFAYADFSLSIPASQAVYAVADELRLELTLTAVKGA